MAPSPKTLSALPTSSLLLRSSPPPISSTPLPEPQFTHGQSKFQDIKLRFEYIKSNFQNIAIYHGFGWDQPSGNHPVKPGDEFHDGKYRAIRKLGRGGCSTVWLAVSASTPRYIALKMVADLESSETEIWIHEYLSKYASGDPRSRHVTTLLDKFQHEGLDGRKYQCLAFEAMGGTAAPLLEFPPEEISKVEHSFKNNSEEEGSYSAVRYPKWVAQTILGHTLRGLAFLHRNGIVHGGNHPGNILLPVVDMHTMRDNEPGRDETSIQMLIRCIEARMLVRRIESLAQSSSKHTKLESRQVIKLSDLGSSFWAASPPKKTDTPVALRSPEEIFGQKIGTGVDIWTFGCLMFEFLTQCKLFVVMGFGNSPEDRAIDDDEHIAQLNEVISPLPEVMMDLWRRSNMWRGPDLRGIIRCNNDDVYVYEPLEKQFHDQKLPDINDEEEAIIISILRQILVYDPDMRPSAEDLLKHPYFADQEVDRTQQAAD